MKRHAQVLQCSDRLLNIAIDGIGGWHVHFVQSLCGVAGYVVKPATVATKRSDAGAVFNPLFRRVGR
jgi:hypothetical protein